MKSLFNIIRNRCALQSPAHLYSNYYKAMSVNQIFNCIHTLQFSVIRISHLILWFHVGKYISVACDPCHRIWIYHNCVLSTGIHDLALSGLKDFPFITVMNSPFIDCKACTAFAEIAMRCHHCLTSSHRPLFFHIFIALIERKNIFTDIACASNTASKI